VREEEAGDTEQSLFVSIIIIIIIGTVQARGCARVVIVELRSIYLTCYTSQFAGI
jgi:hypothetical protein